VVISRGWDILNCVPVENTERNTSSDSSSESCVNGRILQGGVEKETRETRSKLLYSSYCNVDRRVDGDKSLVCS
jgi:hypothetical protein